MATEKELVTGFATTGSIGAAALVISIAAVTVAALNKNTTDAQNDTIATIEARVPSLINDASSVSAAVSIIGTVPVTDGLTIIPKLHFKGLIAGAGIDIAAGTNTITIANIQQISLATATATEADPISLVADTSAPNYPVTRNLIAGTGITLTLSGDDIIIALE